MFVRLIESYKSHFMFQINDNDNKNDDFHMENRLLGRLVYPGILNMYYFSNTWLYFGHSSTGVSTMRQITYQHTLRM